MEIRITSPQKQETIMHQISQILQENGITAQLNSVKKNGDLHLSIATEKDATKAVQFEQDKLGSSFVYSDHAPGY
ncbi:MAG: hypothetical protein HC817_01385 [Saprospiraceae bacterium]|nr:hypothetical protein [Saprospiraceae bacterium]